MLYLLAQGEALDRTEVCVYGASHVPRHVERKVLDAEKSLTSFNAALVILRERVLRGDANDTSKSHKIALKSEKGKDLSGYDLTSRYREDVSARPLLSSSPGRSGVSTNGLFLRPSEGL